MTVPIPPGPPFDLDVLADLHAGVYPDDVAEQLRVLIATDPQASATMAALDATVQDLRSLPPIPMPPEVAARLDAAIAAESSARVAAGASPGHGSSSPPLVVPLAGNTPPGASAAPSPPGPALTQPRPHHDAPTPPPGSPQTAGVSSLDQARRARADRADRADRAADRHRRQARWATGLGIAAAAAAIFTVGAVLLHPGGTPGVGEAGGQVTATTAASSGVPSASAGGGNQTVPAPGAGAGAPSTSPTTQLTQQAIVAQPHHLDQLLPEIKNSTSKGPFADPVRLATCLAANHASTHYVLGILPVTYNGQNAYAISVRTSDSTVRILVVGADCGQSGPDLMEEQSATG